MIQHAHAEFEGYITYKVVAVPLSDGIKKGVLYKHMGKTHTFYFKNGMHKWLNKKENSNLKFIIRILIQTIFTLTTTRMIPFIKAVF